MTFARKPTAGPLVLPEGQNLDFAPINSLWVISLEASAFLPEL